MRLLADENTDGFCEDFITFDEDDALAQAGVLHERVRGQPRRLPTVDDCRDDVRGKVGKPEQPGDIGG